MGNEQSQLSGLEVEEKAVEVTDFWSHHSASVNAGNVSNLSVFVGEPLVGGSLWLSNTPLEKAGKNLMLHRHPCILKYVSSWNKGSKFYLAVEEVKPLAHVLAAQNSLQICIGLHSILKALCFLHEKAFASHNNICIASVYVTKDGSWKLGGMEYLNRFKDLNLEYLSKTRTNRYNKAIDPDEDKNFKENMERLDCIDIYGFSVLALEVLKKNSDENIPSLEDFKELCKNELQNVNITLRPKLNSLLDHPFFKHDFIKIYSFLTELPLKSDQERTEFFTTLRSQLITFDETVVANLLGSLLLSRMVLLNKVAQVELVPFLLCPREESCVVGGLFSVDTLRKYLVPRLLEIFCVRDAQIRLLLLEHFVHFMKCFSKEELQSHVLPELLVGIKDTNNHLVAVTLRTLAELVPILGADVVIGGKRAKLFNDGRPITHPARNSMRRNSRRSPDSTPTAEITNQINDSDISSSNVSVLEVNQVLELPERPRPDGEEGESSTEEIDQSADELDNWEDWDINEEHDNFLSQNNLNSSTNNLLVLESSFEQNQNTYNSGDLELSLQNIDISSTNVNLTKKKSLPDIFELDIKNQSNGAVKSDEFDFFQDMEPVIEASSKFLIDNSNVSSDSVEQPKKLDLGMEEDEQHIVDGWGDEADW